VGESALTIIVRLAWDTVNRSWLLDRNEQEGW